MERTPLSGWMIDNGHSTSSFRDLLQEFMKLKRLSIYTVEAWRAGDRTPNPKAKAAIMAITGLSESDLEMREKA